MVVIVLSHVPVYRWLRCGYYARFYCRVYSKHAQVMRHCYVELVTIETVCLYQLYYNEPHLARLSLAPPTIQLASASQRSLLTSAPLPVQIHLVRNGCINTRSFVERSFH